MCNSNGWKSIKSSIFLEDADNLYVGFESRKRVAGREMLFLLWLSRNTIHLFDAFGIDSRWVVEREGKPFWKTPQSSNRYQLITLQLLSFSNFAIEYEKKARNNKLNLIQYRKLFSCFFFLFCFLPRILEVFCAAFAIIFLYERDRDCGNNKTIDKTLFKLGKIHLCTFIRHFTEAKPLLKFWVYR